jgi:Protein kinase domain/FHA domain
MIGTVLDQKYLIVSRIGGGTFGDVYLAHDELPSRQVAIKRLKDPGREGLNDFVHEMRSLDQLQHPHIVRFLTHFSEAGFMFIVMEYCTGGSLSGLIRGTPLPATDVMKWGKELAETLGQVHQRQIVHHDLKPDNILFGADGRIRIGDFGGANRNIGTLNYLSPEMWRGEASLKDGRVDIYALGITLLELLLGEDPFSGIPSSAIQQAKVRHDFIPTSLDRWVQELLSKATHPEPELRFQTMEEFTEAIDARRVNYVFDRERVQAHRLATRAEKHLSRRQLSSALTCISQAYHASQDCVAAIVADGRCRLFMNRVEEAGACFDKALRLNPRVPIQRELGWLNLEAGNYARAISLLTDHLQRHSDDYEAYNLLLECFYRTERFEAGMRLANMMVKESAPSTCFANNGFICGARIGIADEQVVERALASVDEPFLTHNVLAVRKSPDLLERLLLFENYRFGLPKQKANVVRIDVGGFPREFSIPLVSVGRDEANHVCVPNTLVSRRHCVIVNCAGDVWVYDLGSTFGVFVDSNRVTGKAWLDGVHTIRGGDVEMTVSSSKDLLI